MDLQQMQQATAAPEPGPAPQKAEETTEGSIKANVTSVTSAGYVWIYHTKTFEPSKCNRNMLGPKLQERFPDNTYVWTTIKPGEPTRGHIKCLLHADDPNRKHYDELGFATCGKHNMTSPFQRDQHMQVRHKVEWKTIEKERIDAEKKEERDFQRGMLEAMKRSNDGPRDNRQTDAGSPGTSGEVGGEQQEAVRSERKPRRRKQRA